MKIQNFKWIEFSLRNCFMLSQSHWIAWVIMMNKCYFEVICPLLSFHFFLPSFATAAVTQASHDVVIILLFRKMLGKEKVSILHCFGMVETWKRSGQAVFVIGTYLSFFTDEMLEKPQQKWSTLTIFHSVNHVVKVLFATD